MPGYPIAARTACARPRRGGSLKQDALNTRLQPSLATRACGRLHATPKAADQQRLARAAMEKVIAKPEQNLSNLAAGLTNPAKKPRKSI